MNKIDFSKLTIDDLAANPKRFGLPTFEEFAASKSLREKMLGRPDDAMAAISAGPQKFRKDLKKIKFFIHGVHIPTEEGVETALGDKGYSLADIDLVNRYSRLKKEINMIPLGAGKYDIEVNFLP